jgi:four helix bundle protein
MARVQQFEDLEVWRKARELTNTIYQVTTSGNFNRDFGLRDQLRRASVSVLSNIAEGFERGGDKEFQQFLSVAKGSCGEARAQMYVALDQKHITEEQFQDLIERTKEISRLLSGLMKYLQTSSIRGSKYK